MRAIVMDGTGGPEVLQSRDVPDPAAGPGQLLVRVEAVGVNYFETQIRAGVLALPGGLPAVIGAEAAGEVIDVGEGVEGTSVGTRVVFVTGGRGSYAEYVAVPAAMATPIPDGVSPVDAVAAAPGCVALGLLEKAALTGRETVLVESGAGGVGSYLIQLARKAGAGRVITTAGAAARREYTRTLGADVALDHTDPEWPRALREALNGTTLDVAFASIGGPSTRGVLDALAPDVGRMLCYGNTSGEPPTVDLSTLRGGGTTITGCGGPAWYRRVLGVCRPEILRRVADGDARVLLDSTMPLADAAHAHRRIEDHAALGKIVLVP